MFHYQNAEQNHNIKIANTVFENMAKFKYLGLTVTNQNLIHEEIKSRLNSVNFCYHSVQNLSSCHLLSKDIKIAIYKTIILPWVLYKCKVSDIKGKRLGVFENRMLRRVFGPKRDEMVGGWGKLHNEDRHNFYSMSSIIRMLESRRMRWVGHAAHMGERGMHIGFW
jgi:hypothetical protein